MFDSAETTDRRSPGTNRGGETFGQRGAGSGDPRTTPVGWIGNATQDGMPFRPTGMSFFAA